MGELNVGQIILVVGFIVVMLIKYRLERARKRSEGLAPEPPIPDPPPQQVLEIQTHRQARSTPAPPLTPPASRDPVQRVQVPGVRIPPDTSHWIRKSLLGNPRDMQRGFILMAVLGPCRAFDPPQ